MKICSWNMYCYNRTPEKAFDFIQNLDADLVCLQEVTPRFLERLRTLPREIAYGVEAERRLSRKHTTANYSVILSRHPIRSSSRVSLPETPPRRPARTRLFTSFMRVAAGWTPTANRGILFADIALPRGAVRVFSIHFSLTNPSQRRRELEVARSNVPTDFDAILCGDFNIIDSSYMKSLNWLLGSPLAEAAPWSSERSRAERRFTELRFANPLRGAITHGISRSQLDHILVPEDWHVERAHVGGEKYGSDHRPVFVEIKEETPA